jgi:hypothetical protein
MSEAQRCLDELDWEYGAGANREDVEDLLRAMFADFPCYPKLEKDEYVVDPRTGEYIMTISDKDLYLKYKQQVLDWVARWRLE